MYDLVSGITETHEISLLPANFSSDGDRCIILNEYTVFICAMDNIDHRTWFVYDVLNEKLISKALTLMTRYYVFGLSRFGEFVYVFGGKGSNKTAEQ